MSARAEGPLSPSGAERGSEPAAVGAGALAILSLLFLLARWSLRRIDVVLHDSRPARLVFGIGGKKHRSAFSGFGEDVRASLLHGCQVSRTHLIVKNVFKILNIC